MDTGEALGDTRGCAVEFAILGELQSAMQFGAAPTILSDQALSQIKIEQVKKGLEVVGTEFRARD